MKIMIFNLPPLVTNLVEFLSSDEHKTRDFEEYWKPLAFDLHRFFFSPMDVSDYQLMAFFKIIEKKKLIKV